MTQFLDLLCEACLPWVDPSRLIRDGAGTHGRALGTREYLFDLFAARAAIYGAETLEQFLAYGPRMSLKDTGALDKPTAPQLLVNTVLRTGTTAKEAWVNPTGGHIGRNRELSDAQIFEGVITPWFARRLN